MIPAKPSKVYSPMSQQIDVYVLKWLVTNDHLVHKSHNKTNKLIRNEGIKLKMQRKFKVSKKYFTQNRVVGKTEDNRTILVEKHVVKVLSVSYLQKISEYREKKRNSTYTDETYNDSAHTKSK